MGCGHDTQDFYVHRCGTGTSASRGGVHALIIGTSQYEYKHRGNSIYEKFKNIPGAAYGAAKFAKFLRDDYHDPLGREIATVRLLLTPTEAEKPVLAKLLAPAEDEEPARGEPAERWEPATEDRVRTALFEWFEDCDKSRHNVTVLYAAGHGLTKLRSFTHVFLQATGDHPDPFRFSLNIDVIQEALEYNYSQNKIVITDCCAEVYVKPRYENGIFLEPREERLGELSKFHRPNEPLHIAGASPGANAYAVGASEGTVLSHVLEQLLNSAGELVRHPVRKNEQYFAITQPRMSDLVYSVFRSHPKAKNIPSGGPLISGQTVTGGLHRPAPPPKFKVEFVAPGGAQAEPVDVTITDMSGAVLKSGTISPGHALILELPAGRYKRAARALSPEEFSVDRPARFDVLSGDLL